MTTPRLLVGNAHYRFSDHFRLGFPQSSLDFVDIPLNTDIPLFVDPYALHISSNDWLRECGNLIVDYFNLLVEHIRKGERSRAIRLLDNFHEPNDTHLGFSKGKPRGRGWGPEHANELYEKLAASSAVKSGELRDLGDYELLIPGIGPDKISDLAINIIKAELLVYTEEQCELLGILTEKVSSGPYWSSARACRESRYANLPIYEDSRIVLVPKAAVRTHLIPDHEKFYTRFVLDFLESEHLDANDSLVTTLKNGKKKVLRSLLKESFPLSRAALFEFTQKHPEVLKRYKESLPKQARPLEDWQIESTHMDRRADEQSKEWSKELARIPVGPGGASEFHRAILASLYRIFCPFLTHPRKEKEILEGRKRIDIVFDNSADSGFFSRLVNTHHVEAPYVFVECKNYNEDPQNPELDQLRGRFGKGRGNFGLLVCRRVENRDLMVKRCRDAFTSSEHVVIVLDDEDISALSEMRDANQIEKINDHMKLKLDEIFL
jgi:hypothetical protein